MARLQAHVAELEEALKRERYRADLLQQQLEAFHARAGEGGSGASTLLGPATMSGGTQQQHHHGAPAGPSVFTTQAGQGGQPVGAVGEAVAGGRSRWPDPGRGSGSGSGPGISGVIHGPELQEHEQVSISRQEYELLLLKDRAMDVLQVCVVGAACVRRGSGAMGVLRVCVGGLHV